MRFYPPSPEVSLYESGLEGDELGRSEFGRILSNFVERIEDPLVVAINGKWGTGKTYFLKRWVGAHGLQNNGRAITIYFDAFANDFISEPLLGLTQAVIERLPAKQRSVGEHIKGYALALARPAARVGLSVATAGLSTILNELGDAAVNQLSRETEKLVDDFWKKESGRKRAFENFRATLSAMTINKDKSTRPIIFVIDELDRCRPDYALEVLETIKHMFSVDNVHFVLGINLDALEQMVRNRYGAAIDADAYLRKFITLQMELPADIGDHEKTPTVYQYIKNTSEVMGMPEHLRQELLSQIRIIIRRSSISLRDANKIMSHIMIAPIEAFNEQNLEGWVQVFITLAIARIVNAEMYSKLIEVRYTEAELTTFLDATHSRVNHDDLTTSPNFDYNTAQLFTLWKYLLKGGKLGEEAESRAYDRIFDRVRRGGDVKSIPKIIHQKWLNSYRI